MQQKPQDFKPKRWRNSCEHQNDVWKYSSEMRFEARSSLASPRPFCDTSHKPNKTSSRPGKCMEKNGQIWLRRNNAVSYVSLAMVPRILERAFLKREETPAYK